MQHPAFLLATAAAAAALAFVVVVKAHVVRSHRTPVGYDEPVVVSGLCDPPPAFSFAPDDDPPPPAVGSAVDAVDPPPGRANCGRTGMRDHSQCQRIPHPPPDGASDVDVEVDDDGDDDDTARRLSHIKLWFCNPTTVEGCECFAEHVNDRHSDAHGEGDD
jgi:hypothetical protein